MFWQYADEAAWVCLIQQPSSAVTFEINKALKATNVCILVGNFDAIHKMLTQVTLALLYRNGNENLSPCNVILMNAMC